MEFSMFLQHGVKKVERVCHIPSEDSAPFTTSQESVFRTHTRRHSLCESVLQSFQSEPVPGGRRDKNLQANKEKN